MNRVEFVSYDGKYPCLCMGILVLKVDGVEYIFSCLSSGGSARFDKKWNGHVSKGRWSIKAWPEGFPEDCKEEAVDVVNKNVKYGCCGGCL